MIGTRPTGSQCKVPRNVRSTPREFDQAISRQTSCSPSPFARFHRKAGRVAQEEGFVARDLAQGRAHGRLRRSRRRDLHGASRLHGQFLLASHQRHSCRSTFASGTRYARRDGDGQEHGLQLNMASNTTAGLGRPFEGFPGDRWQVDKERKNTQTPQHLNWYGTPVFSRVSLTLERVLRLSRSAFSWRVVLRIFLATRLKITRRPFC